MQGHYFLILISLIQTSQSYRNNDVTIIATTKNRLAYNNNMIQNRIFGDILNLSYQLAQNYCKKTFKWDKWNCPTEDFLSKRMARKLDRESAFVSAIITASMIYTTTKNCTYGYIPGCICLEIDRNELGTCSDNTKFAEKIADTIFNDRIAVDAQGYATLHNNRAAKLAVRNSMEKLCKCKNILKSKSCEDQICWTSLGTFDIIVNKLRNMYDNALQIKINNKGLVNWNQIPENILVYIHDSLNYCKLNIIPNWNGMLGRQCSRNKNKMTSLQERTSCRNLCRACGLKVYERTILLERRCNCKFVWCCEVTCDICNVTEKEYYCG